MGHPQASSILSAGRRISRAENPRSVIPMARSCTDWSPALLPPPRADRSSLPAAASRPADVRARWRSAGECGFLLRADQVERHTHLEDLVERDLHAVRIRHCRCRARSSPASPLFAVGQSQLQHAAAMRIDLAGKSSARLALPALAPHLEVHDQRYAPSGMP